MPEYSSDVAVAPNEFGSVAEMEAFLGFTDNSRPRVRISVEGYNPQFPEDDIKRSLMDLFNSCGEIVGLDFSIDPAVYRRRAFIVLVGDDAEEKALQLNGTNVAGWTVHVRVAPEEDEETEGYRAYLLREAFFDDKCMFGVGVKGYDTSLPADHVKSALTNHFASCGEITHVFVNTADSEVHIYFSEQDAEIRALALSGSVVQGWRLVTRPLVIATRNFPSPSPPPGCYGVCIPDHFIEMAPVFHQMVQALKISKGMI